MTYTLSAQDVDYFVKEVDSLKEVRNSIKEFAKSNIIKKIDSIINNLSFIKSSNNDLIITKEQTTVVHNSICSLHSIIKETEIIINDKYISAMYKTVQNIQNIYKPYFDAESEKIDRQIDYFGNIGKENNFKSIWSIFEIDDINEVFEGTIKTITYESWGDTQNEEVNLINPTYLTLWKVAEKIILQSKDNHHLYIERFYDRGQGNFQLITGS